MVRIRGCRGLKQLLTLGSHSVHIMNVPCRSRLLFCVHSPRVQPGVSAKHNGQAFSPGSPQSRQPLTAREPISQVMPGLSSSHFWGALLPFFHLRVSSNSRETPAYLSMASTRNGSKGLGWAHALYKDFPRCLHCGRLNFSVLIHLHGS